MSELPPYTGKTDAPKKAPAPKKAAEPPLQPPAAADLVEAAPAPVVAGPGPVCSVAWHSRVLLIGVAGAALLAAILTAVGSANFPSAAPVEQLYAFGLIVDLIAVIVAVGALLVVEFVRRGTVARATLPVNIRPSVFAIVAIVLSAIALVAFLATGAAEQIGYLIQGTRGRYMYWTGGLFVTGIPWALGAIFGAWGLRPRGNPTTNVLAAIALVIWLLLACLTTAAALIYGAGLSD